jgi:DNA-binding CsgD family transcriptional regulator
VTLNRSSSDFSDDDLLLLDLLRPTMSATLRRLVAADRVAALIGRLAPEHGLATLRASDMMPVELDDTAERLLRSSPVDPYTPGGRTRLAQTLLSEGNRAPIHLDGLELIPSLAASAGLVTLGVGALRSQPARLTPRQRQVMDLVRAGFTAKAAAARLGVSARTIEKHLQNTYQRLDVVRNLDALRALDGNT